MTSESQPLLSRPEEKKRIFALPDLPWGQFAIIWLMRLSEPVALISIFPWINDAVGRDPTLHITPAQVGLYSGFIESAFSLGQIFTSYVWSAKSDVYGRKPIFLASLLGITIFSFGMGFARTFRSMVLLRFLTGCFCGATGPVKVVLLGQGFMRLRCAPSDFLAELSTKKTEAAIFSLIPLSWTVGSMLGVSCHIALCDD
jgi:MFS family permease